MGARRKGREVALQVLYLADITKLGAEKALRCVIATGDIEEKIVDFARELAEGTTSHLAALDELIMKYTKNWEMNRMAALDRNLLRLGAYELIYETQTPVSVVIDEAVEIAKTFSTADSGKFVNGILDKIKTERKSSDANGKDRNKES